MEMNHVATGGVVVIGMIMLYKHVMAPLIDKMGGTTQAAACPNRVCTDALHRIAESTNMSAEALRRSTHILDDLARISHETKEEVKVIKAMIGVKP